MGKNMTFWPLVMPQKIFWPDMRFELGTPALEVTNVALVLLIVVVLEIVDHI